MSTVKSPIEAHPSSTENANCNFIYLLTITMQYQIICAVSLVGYDEATLLQTIRSYWTGYYMCHFWGTSIRDFTIYPKNKLTL